MLRDCTRAGLASFLPAFAGLLLSQPTAVFCTPASRNNANDWGQLAFRFCKSFLCCSHQARSVQYWLAPVYARFCRPTFPIPHELVQTNLGPPVFACDACSDKHTTETRQATMAPNETQDRYPKRKRATVNYEIDHSIDGDLDLEDDGNVSEELGEDSTISAGSANSTNAQHRDTITVPEVDSEIEDATFGSRRVKKVGYTSALHPHKLLTPNSVKSSRSPRPSLNPGSSVLPNSSRSDSCEPFSVSVKPSSLPGALRPTFTLKSRLQACASSALY